MIIPEFYSNMHGFDYSIPHFITFVRGTRIVVTPELSLMCYMFRRNRILITSDVLIWRLCLKTSFCLSSVRHLLHGLNFKTPHAWALQKVRGSWIWWWYLFYISCLTIILLLSLMLTFYCPWSRTLSLTFPLTSYSPLYMFIRIQRPVISLSFLLLSWGSFAISLSFIPSLLTWLLWVPLVRCPLGSEA